ncbi:MAG TPA: oxygen-independent coproporphyrinogen III oxidase [Bacteroidia bacterium]|nr:oxygen-independent coproporphyrinogen III oxidase [Bacteroidia bacterium]
MNSSLIRKYDVAAPRYTSYPTVPCWNAGKPSEEQWRMAVKEAAQRDGSISLYIHLPFCESLCTYCACNTRITKNHAVEEPYIENILREWKMYADILPEEVEISELHLGGGTPTFFSPQHLDRLMSGLKKEIRFSAGASLSFEAHPANTTTAHLETLFRHGFRRMSLGVQDFNPTVQKLINRMQSEAQVSSVTNLARIIGYTSVNFDLIYGLPKQTEESIAETIKTVIRIRPDRIAFYSYAHVPWMKPGQRAYSEADLPEGEKKRALYEKGRALLEKSGYSEIGMDHFALPGDELLHAAVSGTLHRNFMGYTEKATSLLIGLGVSAISDAGTMFVQNEKTVEAWSLHIGKNEMPFFKGHVLDYEDLVLRKHISEIMCAGETAFSANGEPAAFYEGLERLKELVADKLVRVKNNKITVTKSGKAFLRNICMCFDARLHRNRPGDKVYSKSA